MLIPEDLRYSPNHEWARLEDGRIRFGITDFAQDALGDVVYVDLPSVNASFERDARVGEVESTKSVSELYVPVGGAIVEVNPALSNQTELINRDPYGDGWLGLIAPADIAEFDLLLSPSQYRELTAE